ncbi:signal transducing adapter molecule 1-like [Amphiura filiformis]|uniref:signal transducing adapter molecule 1-like n=1 Tax=Amphiura filiformis TaxID=82378 RepID=UPI003B21E2C5
MGLFGTSSPFDQDVDKVTSEANTTEDWGLIMDICDRVNANPNAPKDALRSIVRRMKSPVPHVAMQSLTLLAACVNNCGKAFQLEVSSRDFCAEARAIISRGHPKVSEKLRQLVKEWAEGDFKSDAVLSLLVQLYTSLKQEGYDFSSSSTPTPKPAPVSTNPDVVSSQQEEDDIAKAIQLSLQENKKSASSSGSLYPSASSYASVAPVQQPVKKEPRKVKALYDFEAAEDNELTFKSGEIISVLDDSDQNWWKGENFRGVGLFPSNFVTADLTAETEADIKAREKKVSFDESVEVRTIEAAPQEVTINPEQMESCLEMLQNADPTEERQDSQEMLVLEDTCNRMGPLIDQELEKVDREHADLTGLNYRLVEAFSMYHKLMKAAPVYGYTLKGGPQPGMMAVGGAPGQYASMPTQVRYCVGVCGEEGAWGGDVY